MSRQDVHPSKLPVSLEPYNSVWAERFAQEKTALDHSLGGLAQATEHFGSTSVPGLTAKATIDIMLGTLSFPWPDSADRSLETLGYTFYKAPEATWRVYLKPYRGEARGYHLHIAEYRSEHWHTHILFRDYLRQHPEVANEYGELKIDLAEQLKGARGDYQRDKQAFIDAVMEKAERWSVERN